jgi:hypothetical protein
MKNMLLMGRVAVVAVALLSCAPGYVALSGANHPADPRAEFGPEEPASGTLQISEAPPEKVMLGGHKMGGHSGHGGHESKAPPGPMVASAAELAAYLKAKPVFVKYCARCHTPTPGAQEQEEAWEHFTMDSYPFGGHHVGELGKTIRLSVGIDGDEPTMPDDDPGLVEGAELELIAAWSRAFDKARAKESPKHGHGHKMKKKAPKKPGHGH